MRSACSATCGPGMWSSATIAATGTSWHGGDPRRLFAELMGAATGVCGGRGGSQHLYWGNFYSNGVQGGISPVATGMALAEKHKGSGAVVIAFLGDGTLGEGVVYEALNMAALWEAPILYVVENNRIAQTTPVEQALAGSIPARFSAFGIPSASWTAATCVQIYSTCRSSCWTVRRKGAARLDPAHLPLRTAFQGGRHPPARRRCSACASERDPLTHPGAAAGGRKP